MLLPRQQVNHNRLDFEEFEELEVRGEHRVIG